MPTTLEMPPSIAALSAQEAAIAGGRKYIKKRAVLRRLAAGCTLFSILLFTLAFAQVRAMAAELAGNVQGAGLPIAGSTVTLYAAGTGAPTQLAQGKTDDNGAFKLETGKPPADSVLYVIAKGGTAKAAAGKGPNEAIALLTVLGTALPDTVTVNELTTVASASPRRASSTGKRSPEIRSDCGLRPGMCRTWWIPGQARRARCSWIRLTASRTRRLRI